EPHAISDIDLLLTAFILSARRDDTHIVRMLACVSNGDMRHALDMFSAFLSSGNTNVDKVLEIVKQRGRYTIAFHEFLKSAVLGTRRYYRGSLSHVVNVFARYEARGASHFTAPRILRRLAASINAASEHGEGYVKWAKILREYRESFGFADDLVEWCGELMRRELVES
ncbi:MAG: hypothetical protein GY854_15580, partial [Deltaproteobacteria bacterium]|nr:hypothetical protein [Deltaproteobacteria bacterium]